MAVDTPAMIAVLGAGPIGLEAALYARFLGYDVTIYERGSVAENVLAWGHVRMFSPFQMNRSPLGLAALHAQDETYTAPPDEALLTGRQWAERYLLPLSQTDLLVDHLKLQTRVSAIGRGTYRKNEMVPAELRGEDKFLVLSKDRHGQESVAGFDVVIDTTGVYQQPNWLGPGGMPALGECGLRDRMEFHLPDLEQDRARYANRHTLLIGGGYSAASTVVALAELQRDAEQTRVTWIARRAAAAESGPIERFPDDPLPERAALADRANALASGSSAAVRFYAPCRIDALRPAEDGQAFQVQLQGGLEGWHSFDNLVANVGYRPDRELYRELQIHECYASEGPMRLAAALLSQDSNDCLAQTSHGAGSLQNPEPHFYVLGSKSYGRRSHFLISIGLEQIRELFSVLGDRADLDLYAGAASLPH